MKEKPAVFVTRMLPGEIMRAIRRRYRVTVNPHDRPLTRAEILRGVRSARGLVAMLNDRIDAAVIRSAPRLGIICNYAVGTNNIDIEAASMRNIAVTNTPGVLTETTADLAWALMLSAARRLRESESLVRSGRWTGWAPTQFLGADVHGKVLGIVGMGRIGRAVALRASGFSMKVLYHSRRRIPRTEEKRLHARYASLNILLCASDFVSLHLPLTGASRHLIDRRAFGRMKRTAILINTARGPVVDEAALIAALESKRIAGAGLDVFENEPRLSARLRRIASAVILPHIGSASTETRTRMGVIVLENLSAYFSGRRPPHRVN